MPVVERHGVRLYYTDSGSGPAVLFHAGGGGDGRMWEFAGYTAAFALLANGSAVVLWVSGISRPSGTARRLRR